MFRQRGNQLRIRDRWGEPTVWIVNRDIDRAKPLLQVREPFAQLREPRVQHRVIREPLRARATVQLKRPQGCVFGSIQNGLLADLQVQQRY